MPLTLLALLGPNDIEVGKINHYWYIHNCH